MTLRNKRRTIVTAGASLALAAIVGVGVSSPSTAAWAAGAVPGMEQVRQDTPPPPRRPNAGPGQNGARQQQHQQQQEEYLQALAARLGISVEKLKEAQKQARIDMVNKAVADGKLDRARADQIIAAIQSGQRPGPGPRGQGQGQGPGMRGQGPGFGGPGVAAQVLGMTPEQLRAELQSGKSLAEIGQAKGISRDQLKAQILAAQKAKLDEAVKANKLSQEQANQIAARQAANIDRMLDMKHGQRGPAGAPGQNR
jgi:hypothetical protein